MKRVALNILSAHKVFAEKKIEDLEEKRIIPKMVLRRRLTRNAKIMLYLADKTGFKDGSVVYGSAFGELQATVGITDAILEKTPISPTYFQNSVYNTAPSYFSLLNENKGEIITISSGEKTSAEVLKTAALQALVSGEKILCVATECLDIERIAEVNNCTDYLEAGACVVVEIADDASDAVEISDLKENGIIESLQELFSLVKMYENGTTKVLVDL